MPNQPQLTTSALALTHAHRVFQGDWDTDGVTTTHLPTAVAEDLLAARGWTHQADSSWQAPSGERIWHTSDALQLALAADTHDRPATPADPSEDLRRIPTGQAIGRELLDDLIRTVLGHDALHDEVDELLFDHVVAHERTREQIAAALPTLITDTLAAAATASDWQRHTDHLIAETRALENDDPESPTTRKDPSR